MCGILGVVGTPLPDIAETNFAEALNLMERRGPDSFGMKRGLCYYLGHRRLSVIDLSDSATQPMTSEDGKVHIVFNGEIYNYLDLRRELISSGHNFKTNGDTEVLLKGFLHWGLDLVPKLRGMFAFAIVDQRTNVVHLIRDRLGIKPLYFHVQKNVLYFASQANAILHLSDHKREIDQFSIGTYFLFRQPIGDRTFFKDVKPLKPGHTLSFTNGHIFQTQYWDVISYINEGKFADSESEIAANAEEKLITAVQRRLVSDVPVGSFLSGGLDSSLVTAMMAKLSGSAVKTYNIGFDGISFNEFEYANTIAELYRTDHFQEEMSGGSYFEHLEYLLSANSLPLAVPNEVAIFALSKKMKENITVVLSGEGADELFGGYGRIFRSVYDYERYQLGDTSFLDPGEKPNWPSELIHFASSYTYNRESDFRSFISPDLNFHSIQEYALEEFRKIFKSVHNGGYLDRLMATFLKVHIVGLLQRLDNATMAASVEGRVPFLDHDLVEYAVRIPWDLKLRWKSTADALKSESLPASKISEVYDIPKYILKKLAEKYLPTSVVYRKKVGFPVPLHNWIGTSWNTYIRDILLSKSCRERGIFNHKNLEAELSNSANFENREKALKIWMLLNLELFFRIHG